MDHLAAPLRRACAPMRRPSRRLLSARGGGEGDDASEQPLDATLARVLTAEVGGDVGVHHLVVLVDVFEVAVPGMEGQRAWARLQPRVGVEALAVRAGCAGWAHCS